MKTFRDELWNTSADKKAFIDAVVAPTQELIAATLKKYGNWRVVEGVLRVEWRREENKTLAWIDAGDGDLAHRHVAEVGRTGDHVTLILPPEEKAKFGAKAAIDMTLAMLEVSRAQTEESRQREADERTRADKYEKALREIVAVGYQCQWPSISEAKRVAMRALEE